MLKCPDHHAIAGRDRTARKTALRSPSAKVH
jgi:hypothetical protein